MFRSTAILICTFSTIIFLSGCSVFWDQLICEDPEIVYSSLYQDPPDNTVWVFQELSGGVQCDGEKEQPPDTVRLFLDNGIAVYDFYSGGPGVVCLACSCPDYVTWHYVLIAEVDVPFVAEFGYVPESM